LDTSFQAADISLTVMAIIMAAMDTGQNGRPDDTMDMEAGTDTATDTATEMDTEATMVMDTAIEVIPAMDMSAGATMVTDMATETTAMAIVDMVVDIDMVADTVEMGMAIVREDVVVMGTEDPMADIPIAVVQSPSVMGVTVTRRCSGRHFSPLGR
jgi:hypothetical protein